MSQPRDDRQDDLFRPSLEKIINLRHPLVRLAAEIDWDFLAGRFRGPRRMTLSRCDRRLTSDSCLISSKIGDRTLHRFV